MDEHQEVLELEELDDNNENENDFRENEKLEELESVKEIEPLIIENDMEDVEYLEAAADVVENGEFDVEYISNEWIKEYNRNINIMDNVFEELRKQKMEELTGFAEMAILEEIKELEYNELKNLTLSDKIKIMRDEKNS